MLGFRHRLTHQSPSGEGHGQHRADWPSLWRQSPHKRHIFGRFQIYRFKKGAPKPLNRPKRDLTIAGRETFTKGERACPTKIVSATWRLKNV